MSYSAMVGYLVKQVIGLNDPVCIFFANGITQYMCDTNGFVTTCNIYMKLHKYKCLFKQIF